MWWAVTATAIIVVVVALGFAAFYLWHLWRIWLERRRHTRERFLFLAFRTIAAVILGFLDYLFGGARGFQLVARLTGGTSIDLSANPNQTDRAVAGVTVVLVALITLTYLAFRNWHGPQSEFERRNPERAALQLIIAFLVDRDRRRLMLQPGQEPPPQSLPPAPPTPPGHLRAMNLIMAHDAQYQVRAEDGTPRSRRSSETMGVRVSHSSSSTRSTSTSVSPG